MLCDMKAESDSSNEADRLRLKLWLLLCERETLMDCEAQALRLSALLADWDSH